MRVLLPANTKSKKWPVLGLALAFTIIGASAASPQQPAEAPATSFAFDVASIRPSAPDSRNFSAGFMPSGYRATNFTFAYYVLSAYLPGGKGNELIGAPDWAIKEHYDIVAHIDEATAPLWLKLNGRQRWQAGRPMLQKLLAERCNLVVHTVPSQVDGYALVVSKGGPHLLPGHPRESYPDGVKDLDPEGGRVLSVTDANNVTMTFFNVLLPDLANLIGGTSSSIVEDQTNLTGRYDFTVRRVLIPRDVDGQRISDPQPSDFWDISSTGLELRRAKIPSQNLVIDHIERPSEN